MLQTVYELVNSINPIDVLKYLWNRREKSEYITRLYTDALYELKSRKPVLVCPGHEQILGGLIEAQDLPCSFLLLFFHSREFHSTNLTESSINEISSLYISNLLLKSCTFEMLIGEIVFSLCYKEIQRFLFHEYIMAELCPETDNTFLRERIKEPKRIFTSGSFQTPSNELLLAEMDQSFGHQVYWGHLLPEFKPTENLCKNLIPNNPPTLFNFVKYMEIIHEKYLIWGCFSTISEEASIVVEKQAPPTNIPSLVYVHKKSNEKNLPSKDSLDELLRMPIIVKDDNLYNNSDLLCGTLLLYLAFPRRIKRELRESSIKKLLSILQTRACIC